MEFLSLRKENKIAVITLNRPPANALSRAVLTELGKALDEVEHDKETKSIIIHGEGRFFAAGADIKEFTTISSGKEFEQLARLGQELFDRIERFPKPVIAAIHGAALGGGLELAMACHIRLAIEDAKLGLPELNLGLIPGFAGTQRLPRVIGKAKALEMILTGEPITGLEGKALGLINSTYTEQSLMMEAAYKLAGKIAEKSGVTIRLALEAFAFANDENFPKGVLKEAELFGQAFETEDGQEGIAAFVEKRKPRFKN